MMLRMKGTCSSLLTCTEGSAPGCALRWRSMDYTQACVAKQWPAATSWEHAPAWGPAEASMPELNRMPEQDACEVASWGVMGSSKRAARSAEFIP